MHRFLVRFSGELSLKGKRTRHRFVDRLVHNMADAFRSHGLEYDFERRWSRLLFSASSEGAARIACRVFGVQAVAAMETRSWRSLEDLLELGEEIFTPDVEGRTFAVRVHRGEHAKKVPFTSPEAERALGARLIDGAAGVDLTSPEVEAHVELRGDEAYFYGRPLPAEGGLPLGTEGRALALVSGGFDSPVAAWAVQRRGVRLDYLFCNLGGEDHLRDVVRVMKVIADRWSYGTRPRLVVVDFRPVVEELRARTHSSSWQVLLKRQMLRVGEGVARSLGALALVTGEAVGQVSSQTLHNLAACERVVDIPVLRPLVAWNKEEITALARRVGTYDLSRQVPEYCGLEGDHGPTTHAKAHHLERQERFLDGVLLSRLLDQRAVLDLRGFEVSSLDAGLDVETVPGGAQVLDLRTERAFDAWHLPGSRRLDYPEALESFRELDPGTSYVAVCEIGMKSAHLAEVMSAAGYRARHLGGGFGSLLRRARDEDPALLAALSPAVRD